MELTPSQHAAVKTLLSNREWRLNHLYHIVNKDGKIVRFRMNWAQRQIHNGLHYYNNVLKARQLGISTYTAMLILDMCLFTPHYTAGIVDRTGPESKKKLAKIKFAFDHLDHLPQPPTEEDRQLALIGTWLKEEMKSSYIGATEAKFPNGKAEETITGTLNSIDQSGIVILESTHEGGQYGLNYRLVMEAMDLVGKPLTPLDPKFWFFSWVEQPEYRIKGGQFSNAPELAKYFHSLEIDYAITLDEEQKAWYESKSRTQGYKMRQEYPTVPDEALNPIASGAIYGSQINRLRELGRLTAEYEPDPYRPIYAVFDKGMADFTSIWWIQPRPDGLYSILDNYTANGLPLDHYIGELRQRDALYGRLQAVILPHDGVNRDYNGVKYYEKLETAGYSTILVKRTSDIWASIDSTRTLLRHAVIHARCSQQTALPNMKEGYISGVDALANYKMAPAGKNGVTRNEPLHDLCSHAADSLRTFADALAAGLIAKETGWKTDEENNSRSPYSGLARGAETLYL